MDRCRGAHVLHSTPRDFLAKEDTLTGETLCTFEQSTAGNHRYLRPTHHRGMDSMSFSNSDLKNMYRRLAPLSDRTGTGFARALRGERIAMLDSALWFTAALCFLTALVIVFVTA